MSATALFLTGLSTGAVAGGASCAAVQGGLLAGAVGRRRAAARAGVGAVAEPTSAWRAKVAESTRPIGVFLAAKLVSHTALGAVLGAVGAAAEPGPRTRAILLLVAAALMVVFALDLLGVRAVRRLVPRAPQAWTRRVRRAGRSESAFTPALLGFLTVLLPCGVTLSVSLLAIASASPLAGAAAMAGFVLGTAPLFAVLGVLLHRSTRVLQGRLSIATGIVVLAVAALSVNSALTLGGWRWPDAGPISAASSAGAVRTLPDGTQVVRLTVRSGGYAPAALAARAGVPTRLELVTAGTGGCTRAFVIPSRGVQQVLPESGTTTVELGTPGAGTLRYTCGMGMYTGRIQFESISTDSGTAR
ncbi:MAG: urease accessory protein UreH domain-containing protein [Sporichthyaceae bacterium]